MPTIAIANQAGSAGKTTTAVTLAGLLAESGRTVRVIDSDAQANATFALGVVDPELSISDVLLRTATLDEVEVATKVDGLSLVPATEALDGTAVELTKEFGGERRLRQQLRHARPVDVTIIDCPGAKTVLTVGALFAADFVVTVTQPTLKELAGVQLIQETIEALRENLEHPGLDLVAVVPCVVPPPSAGKVYEAALTLAREMFGELVSPEVRRSTRVPEAYSHQVPLHIHAPREGVTDDYRAVLRFLQERGVL